MRCAILAILLLTGFGGCGTPADPRLQITSELREACPEASDFQLAILIQDFERKRLAGDTYTEQLVDVFATCKQNEDPQQYEPCKTCATAILYQLYPF